jgi:hypothetical protein
MRPARVSQSIAVATSLLFGQACFDTIDTGDDVGLHVTEVQAPASAPASGPITVTLTVAIGDCVQFDHIAASRTPSSLTLSARGIDPGGNCPAILRHESHSYEAQGPFTNPLTITVYRPTADPLIRTVSIE